jgi:hypothetical protein
MRSYAELPGFAGFLLEESYVLDIEAHPARIRFVLDLVLTVDHPQYADPAEGEQCCYRRGELLFEGVTRFVWGDQGRPPAHDANGETDFGHIDTFEWDEAGFLLDGGWGRLEILADRVNVTVT